MRWLAIPLVALLATPALAAPDAAFFAAKVRPILVDRCLDCHGGTDPKAGLDLTRKPADVALLWKRIDTNEMPPKHPLPADEKAVLKGWVAAGAPWSAEPIDQFATTTRRRAGLDWWSLQPVRPGNYQSIDAYIQAALRDQGMIPAPPADRRTLLRRVYYDLVGFPPTAEQVEAFVHDASPDAWEKVVDRLLASPHYGERWGRHWLDVARYAETCGYERDQVKPDIWKYRDWVVAAFNADLPYDRFIMHQLAGDEVVDRTTASVIATGFVRLGTWNDEPNDPNEYKYDRLEDMVHATSTAFLGLTVKCARCHDHKFDPIRQTDYHRLAGAFWAGFIEPGPREHLGGPDAKILGEIGVFGWTDRGREVPPLRLLKKGDPNRPGPVVEPGHLSVVPTLDKPLSPPPADAKTTTRRLQLARWITDPANPLTARVMANRVWAGHFGRGLVRTPDNFGFTGEKPTHPELLDWLAADLIAGGWRTKRLHRMILLSETYRQSSLHPKQDEYAKADAANRLWWRAERRRLDAEALRDSLLFASGRLDLGRIGGPSFAPDIPADALEGLSMKAAAWKPSPPAEQTRRSLYVFAKRGLLPPLLTTFDLPDTTLPSCRRDVTTVPTQALALLNNPFVHEQSAALARRVGTNQTREGQVTAAWRFALGREPRPMERAAAVAHLEAQTNRFAGRPEPEHDALASLCHVLLNTNEFLYVD